MYELLGHTHGILLIEMSHSPLKTGCMPPNHDRTHDSFSCLEQNTFIISNVSAKCKIRNQYDDRDDKRPNIPV